MAQSLHCDLWNRNKGKPVKGKPSERLGRKAIGLNSLNADMVARLPGNHEEANMRPFHPFLERVFLGGTELTLKGEQMRIAETNDKGGGALMEE